MTSAQIEPLLPPLIAVQRLLGRFGGHGLIIGGVAVSVLGAPRLTADVDVVLLLPLSRLTELLGFGRELGLAPRISNAEQFGAALEMPQLWDDIKPLLRL